MESKGSVPLPSSSDSHGSILDCVLDNFQRSRDDSSLLQDLDHTTNDSKNEYRLIDMIRLIIKNIYRSNDIDQSIKFD